MVRVTIKRRPWEKGVNPPFTSSTKYKSYFSSCSKTKDLKMTIYDRALQITWSKTNKTSRHYLRTQILIDNSYKFFH